MKILAAACLLCVQLSAPFCNPVVGQSLAYAPVYAKNGMVASSQEIASQVGFDILKRGGNAVDVAVAVAFTMAVTWPAAGNIGGGRFMLIRKADGTTAAIDMILRPGLVEQTRTRWFRARRTPLRRASGRSHPPRPRWC